MSINLKSTLVAGAVSEGHGAICSWHGAGPLRRVNLLAAIEEAGLPADWAPKAKSLIAHIGDAIACVNHKGYVARRARSRADRKLDRRVDANGQTVTWDARWVVFEASSDVVVFGDAAGKVVMTAELHGEELRLDGDAPLCSELRADFEARRDAELYQANDITSWFRGILLTHCGATTLGMNYYVPARGRNIAQRMATSLSQRWGNSWMCPLIPLATTDELKQGIANGFRDTANQLIESAAGDIDATTAGRLLGDLERLHERVAAYRELVGDAMIADAVIRMRELHARLHVIVGGSGVRFAMMELLPLDTALALPERSAAELAAEALQARRQELDAQRAESPQPEPKAPPSASQERQAIIDEVKADLKGDSAERFGLLELE